MNSLKALRVLNAIQALPPEVLAAPKVAANPGSPSAQLAKQVDEFLYGKPNNSPPSAVARKDAKRARKQLRIK